jgi:hypothetical protein
MKFRLYIGLEREGKWFNYAEINSVTGGALAVLDGTDKSGAARFINLFKKSMPFLYTGDGESYEMKEEDFKDIYMEDAWKAGREAMKIIANKDSFIFNENFFCSVCSIPGMEKYTEINEDWDKLIEEGILDEIYLNNLEDKYYTTSLPVGVELPSLNQFVGGTFKEIKRRPLTLEDMAKIQKNAFARQSEANMFCAMWDASIVEITGLTARDINVFVKRNSQDSFCKKYLIHSDDITEMKMSEPIIGINAEYRTVTCKSCGSEIGGYLDFTNFFQSLLPTKSSRK